MNADKRRCWLAVEYSRIKIKEMKRNQQWDWGGAADALPGRRSRSFWSFGSEVKCFKQQRVISRLNAAEKLLVRWGLKKFSLTLALCGGWRWPCKGALDAVMGIKIPVWRDEETEWEENIGGDTQSFQGIFPFVKGGKGWGNSWRGKWILFCLGRRQTMCLFFCRGEIKSKWSGECGERPVNAVCFWGGVKVRVNHCWKVLEWVRKNRQRWWPWANCLCSNRKSPKVLRALAEFLSLLTCFRELGSKGSCRVRLGEEIMETGGEMRKYRSILGKCLYVGSWAALWALTEVSGRELRVLSTVLQFFRQI